MTIVTLVKLCYTLLMINLIDRFILFAFSCVLVNISGSMPGIMITALVAFILAGINILLMDYDSFVPDMIVCIVVCAFGLYDCSFLLFMPLFLYSYVCKYLHTISYRWISFILIILCFIIEGFINQPRELVVSSFAMIISFLAAYKTSIIEEQTRKIIKLRDDGKENTLLLENKNKVLKDKQDKDIHIAVLDERNRIAREIHDNVGHLLSRSILQIGAIMAVTKDETVKALINPLHGTLDEAMNSIRNSVHDLHKESFDMNEAVKKILEDLKDFHYEYKCDISRDADSNVKYAFLTILKEAVNNIIKYCDGDSVNVLMVELEEHYQMVVEDNGVAIRNKNEEMFNEGIGLINIKERVEGMSGFVTFSKENGFRIFISIPKCK